MKKRRRSSPTEETLHAYHAAFMYLERQPWAKEHMKDVYQYMEDYFKIKQSLKEVSLVDIE